MLISISLTNAKAFCISLILSCMRHWLWNESFIFSMMGSYIRDQKLMVTLRKRMKCNQKSQVHWMWMRSSSIIDVWSLWQTNWMNFIFKENCSIHLQNSNIIIKAVKFFEMFMEMNSNNFLSDCIETIEIDIIAQTNLCIISHFFLYQFHMNLLLQRFSISFIELNQNWVTYHQNRL